MHGTSPPHSPAQPTAAEPGAARAAYRNLPQLLLKSREELLRHFRPIINHFGLTEQQWRILRTLGEHGSLEPWEICEHCQILSPSLAGVLSRMDDMGIIVRERVPEDQRRVKVQLSAAGHELVARMSPLIHQQYQLLENSLGPELLRDLYAVLDRLAAGERSPVERIDLSQVEVPARAAAEPPPEPAEASPARGTRKAASSPRSKQG